MVIKGKPKSMLPYTRWLDWCKIAVLARLEAIGKQEAAAMRRRLQDVRNAFVWRPPAADPLAQPSAADYLLAEGCVMARRFRAEAAGLAPPPSVRPKPPDPASCIM